MQDTMDKSVTTTARMPCPYCEGEFQFVVEGFGHVSGDYAEVRFRLLKMRTAAEIVLKTGTYHRPKVGWEVQPDTTIQVNCERAVLKFRIVDEKEDPGRYRAVGIGFSRADGTVPRGVACTTAAVRLSDHPRNGSPFHGLKLNEEGWNIQVTDTLIKEPDTDVKPEKQKEPRSHTTYRFMIVIQDRDTGRYGVIDPEVENLN